MSNRADRINAQAKRELREQRKREVRDREPMTVPKCGECLGNMTEVEPNLWLCKNPHDDTRRTDTERLLEVKGCGPDCRAKAVVDALRADLLAGTVAGGAHNTPLWIADMLTDAALATTDPEAEEAG